MKRLLPVPLLAAGLLLPGLALADDGVTAGQFTANNVWMMLCAGLVFIMHLGFATLESGLTRAKNTTNILFKNTFIFSTNPEHSFATQLIGVGAYGLAAFGAATAIFGTLRAIMGIRVSEGEELEGLDLAEHGGRAYDLSGPTSILETVTDPSRVLPRPAASPVEEPA